MLPNTDHIGEPRSISRGGPNPQANDGVRGDAQNGPQANGEAQGVGGNANGADNGAVSRQVYRQAQRHNDKRRERPTYYYQADWPSWCLERGPDGKFVHGPDGKLKPSAFFKHVHPIIPFGAPVRKPGLAGGKVVGQMADDGIWDGKKDWTSEPRRTTWEEAKKAHRDGAALCVQATKLIPFDCDLEKMELVEKTLKLIIKHFGSNLCVRLRDNSNRFLSALWLEDGEPAVAKTSWKIFDPNGDHVGYFEVLGANQQFVVEGMHKSGVPIKWINRPCDNPQNIPRITHAKLQAFLDDLRQEFETFGYRVEVVQGKNGTILRSSTNEGGTSEHSSKSAGGSGAGGSVRKSIDDPSRHAPSPQHVLRLLKVWRNTPENVPSHNEFVAAIAAIKTALGPDREDYYSDILDWALEYRGNHKDYVRARWDSIS